MRVVALAVDEEGEEEEEEEEDEKVEKEKEEKTEKLTVNEQERYTRHRWVNKPTMRPATTPVEDKNQRPTTTYSNFLIPTPLPLLLLLMLLLPVWILSIVVDASPVHLMPLHKSELYLFFVSLIY